MDYVGSLTADDRADYLKKLTLSNGVCLPDPYTISEDLWCADRNSWPVLIWQDIYSYLIDTPSVYTKEKVRAYKSLDAFNYVLSGHLQGIKCFDATPDFCVVRSDVLPSQKQGATSNHYDAWVYINKASRYILTANCTCMAG